MVVWILGKEITNFTNRSTKKECLFDHAERMTSSVMGRSNQSSFRADCFRFSGTTPVSAKKVSVTIPAEQGSASCVDTGVGLCSVPV